MQEGLIFTIHVSSEHQIVDILTNALPIGDFIRCSKLSVIDIYAPVWKEKYQKY